MRLGLWEAIAVVLETASVQQAACLGVGSALLLRGDTERAVGLVAEALGLQLDSGPLHHRWMAKELQNQRCGGAGCGGVSGEDQLYCCFLQMECYVILLEIQCEVLCVCILVCAV